MVRLLAWLSAMLFSVAATASEVAAPRTFRVMSYNIHHGEGPDGKIDLERIAKLIKAEKADIVALQEVDRGVARTARRDLVGELATLTGMNHHFEKNIDYQGGEYGNAILTRFPILQKTNTHYRMLREREQRGLLAAVLDIHGRQVLLLNTHLDFRKDDAERLMNVTQIKQTVDAYPGRPIIFCGDFNATPDSRTYQRLNAFLRDAWKDAGQGSGFTFPSGIPAKRIDYIWVSENVRTVRMWVPPSDASDHLPVIGEFSLGSE